MLDKAMAALRARLIDDWRHCWRFFTVQLNALALLWMAIYQIAPSLPPEITAAIPTPFQGKVVAAYAFLGLVARLIAQKKPSA